MAHDGNIFISLLDDCWEPASAIEVLRRQVQPDDPGRTRWLWVLAGEAPSRESLLRRYGEHSASDGGSTA